MNFEALHLAVPPPTRNARPQADTRTALRLATSAKHESLQRIQALADVLRGDLAHSGYANLLLRLLALHAAVERKLAAHLRSPCFAWYGLCLAESRSAQLRRDLAALGTPPFRITAAMTSDIVLPVLSSPEAALGCAWVVEGSSHGGRVLARQVASGMGVVCTSAASLFRSDSEQPARWAACCEAVNVCGAEPDRRSVILASAAATFEAFEIWLAET